MALSIKSVEVEELARKLAARTGQSITGAIQEALEQRLERIQSARPSRVLAAHLDDILRRVDDMPDLNTHTADEIIGYDEDGLPR
jgi:antitoxin VapB